MKRTAILRRSPLRRVSKKRQREGRTYSLLREAFLKARPNCEACAVIKGVRVTAGKVFCAKVDPSQDVHHQAGRYGGNYLNTDTWLAVCRGCHDWIHTNPATARGLGLLT
jgi:hypothetical protein